MDSVSHHRGAPEGLAESEGNFPLDVKPTVSQHRPPRTGTGKPHLKITTESPTGAKAGRVEAGAGRCGSWRPGAGVAGPALPQAFFAGAAPSLACCSGCSISREESVELVALF